MKIRDSFATVNGDSTTTNMPSGGLEVVADDGRTLFSIRLADDGTLEVSGGADCVHEGMFMGSVLNIEPRASNLIYVRKERHRA